MPSTNPRVRITHSTKEVLDLIISIRGNNETPSQVLTLAIDQLLATTKHLLTEKLLAHQEATLADTVEDLRQSY